MIGSDCNGCLCNHYNVKEVHYNVKIRVYIKKIIFKIILSC